MALYTVPFDNGVEGDRGYVNDTNNDISNNNSGYYHQDDTHNNNALNNNQGQEQQFNGNHQNIVQGSPDIQHRHII